MVNNAKLQQETEEEDESLLQANKNDSFKLDTISSPEKDSEKQFGSLAQVKFNGNMRPDIIHLMSLKPEQFEFSFTGLRRYLGIHQQQLVNTIDRLLEDSILHKTQDGYLLRPEFRKNNKNIRDDWTECEVWMGTNLYPTPIPIQKVYKKLHNKWFGKNRFLGGVNDPKNNRIVLDWVNMDNPESKTRLEATTNKTHVKFKDVSLYERDKALNVFSETFLSLNNPIMFENTNSYKN